MRVWASAGASAAASEKGTWGEYGDTVIKEHGEPWFVSGEGEKMEVIPGFVAMKVFWEKRRTEAARTRVQFADEGGGGDN